jgi:hypothetical protein
MSKITPEMWRKWEQGTINKIEEISSHQDKISCMAPDDESGEETEKTRGMELLIQEYVRMSILPDKMKQEIELIIKNKKQQVKGE